MSFPALPALRRAPAAGSFDVSGVPLEAHAMRRVRTRRGGPRTPIALVGAIAVCTGVGLAYVAQVAHATQATYQAAQLQADGNQLRANAAALDDQLARLRATERVVTAAQALGMRPAGHWIYVNGVRVSVVAPPGAPLSVTASAPTDPLQRLIAELGSVFGLGDTRQ